MRKVGMPMIQIIPSLASADPLNLKECLDSLGSVSHVHLDIEDGNFVPNITFGLKTALAVRAYTSCQLDAHLLVTHPLDYLEPLLNAGVDAIAIHVESTAYPSESLTRIRKSGAKAGLAFNCKTDIAEALPYVDDLDYVLIMTSEPDGRAQQMKPRILGKIRYARNRLPKTVAVMVDGGIGSDSLTQVVQAGADSIILGRAIWSAKDPESALRQFFEQANGGQP